VRVRKLNKAHRRLNGASVALFAKILDSGQPTRFRWEGSLRAGIRAFLVLHGDTWRTADDNAAQILKLAFWSLKVMRPSWHEGQTEWTRLDGGRIYCANESCQKPIEGDSLQTRMYCCNECRQRAKSKRGYHEHAEENVIRARAARVAARALGETRVCEWCARQFQALDYAGKKPQRFCSRTCRSRFASSCAASWRPRLLDKRPRSSLT
jgi:hypothetical protein